MRPKDFWLVWGVLLCACGQEEAPRAATEVRDSAGLTIAETDARLVPTSAVFARVTDTLARVGSRDDSPGAETLFQVAAARFLDDGDFVVLQGGTELRFYSASGSRRLTVGRRGQGPGEYELARGLRRTSGGNLAVWDAQLGRMSIVTPQGEFLRSSQLDLEQVAQTVPSILQIRPDSRWDLLDARRLLVFDYSFSDMPKEGPARPRVQYLVWPLNGVGVDTVGEYGGIEQTLIPRSRGIVVPALDPEDSYFALDEMVGHLYVGDGGTGHIERFDTAGRLDLRIDLANIDRRPDPERMGEAKAALLEQLGRRGLQSMDGAVDEMAAQEDSPTFRGLATDGSDHLWVRWGQQPDSPDVLYAVFDSQGRFCGRVVLPPHEKILAFSHGRVLLLQRSPLGIETIGVFGIGQ